MLPLSFLLIHPLAAQTGRIIRWPWHVRELPIHHSVSATLRHHGSALDVARFVSPYLSSQSLCYSHSARCAVQALRVVCPHAVFECLATSHPCLRVFSLFPHLLWCTCLTAPFFQILPLLVCALRLQGPVQLLLPGTCAVQSVLWTVQCTRLPARLNA